MHPACFAAYLALVSGHAVAAGGNPRLEFALGVLEETRGHGEAAAGHFESALRLDPQAAPLVLAAVERRLAAGQRTAAVRLIRELAAARPDDLGLQLGLVDFLLREGRGDTSAEGQAQSALEAALDQHGPRPEVIRRLFSLHFDAGRRKPAEEAFAALTGADAASALLRLDLARTLHDADDKAAWDEVERSLDEALAADPADPRLARAVSEHYRTSGRRDKAIAILKDHVGAAPWSLDLRARLGVLCFAAGQNDEGRRAFAELLEIHPRHLLAHRSMARFYRTHDDPARAAHHAGEVLRIRGGDPKEFLELAEEHLAADRPREARLLLEKGVFHHPDKIELRVRLAVATRRDPETRTRAAGRFREVESAAPEDGIDDPDFLTGFAELLIEDGRSREAEDRLRAAIRLYPPDAKRETAAALRRLASLWETENRNLDAARALRHRAAALAPE